jgi:hypothetical protein
MKTKPTKKKSAVLKLLKRLPPFPPVPRGYDRWAPMGVGYSSDKAHAYLGYIESTGHHAGWEISEDAHAYGVGGLLYIVAVRDPKPAPTIRKSRKVAPKPAGKGRVVAKLEKRSAYTGRGYYADSDRFVLPADAASVERMVEQVRNAFCERAPATPTELARAVLSSIGILPANKGTK